MTESSWCAVFEIKDDWERCLDPEERPADIMKTWTGVKEKDTNFVFKKRVFVREDSKEIQDPVARQYVYLQAVTCVNDGTYPSGVEDAERLAGLQLQVVYGDHNEDTHQIGFLSHNLQNFVPRLLMPMRKNNEWEARIFKEHKKNRGKSTEQAQLEYLGIVTKWDYYGTTFFPPCKFVPSKTMAKQLKGKIAIGVNQDGIVLLKPKDKTLVSKHPYTEVCSWASSPASFAFEFGSPQDANKYQFETKYGAIIASTIQTYIDILVDMLTRGEGDDDDSASGGNLGSDMDSEN